MTRALRQNPRTIARGRLLCCSALGLVLAAVEILPARAAPAGASVPAGVAAAPTITSSGPVTDVKLNQSRTLIDWSSFQIAQGETVNFRFNAGSDIVLNRVLGQAVVDGALNGLVGAKVGGNVWLYGGQGVVFGPHAQVNVGGLLATTTPLSSVSDFLSGSNAFTFQGGQADASVLARSGAQLSSRGALALIAPSVATEAGAQVSAGGTALYGAAQNYRIHFDEGAGGNLDLVDFEVPASALEDGSISATPLAIAGDTAGAKAIFAAVSRPSVMNAVISLGGLVTAKGAVQGEGGDIILSATGAPASVRVGGDLQADRSVSMTAPGGQIEVAGAVTARDATGQGGAITLGDGSTASVSLDAGGRLDVASTGAGQVGGRAVATGTTVDVEGTVDASGPAGGGAIRIGGGFHGQDATVANADHTTVGMGAVLSADATAAGDGGTVALWSQKATAFGGLIQARGGPGGGNGGQAEVSSLSVLGYTGLADLTAPKGAVGGLLLDPDDITIQTPPPASNYTSGTGTFTASASSSIDPAQIATQIQTAALTINTTTTITFVNPIVYNHGSNSSLLTMNAGGGFVFNVSPFSVTGNGGLNVTMVASDGGAHTGFTLPSGTTLATGGGALTINADSISLAGTIDTTTGGSVSLTSTAGGISGTGAISTAALTAHATGGDIDLNGSSNAVSGTITLTGNNVTFFNNQTTSIAATNLSVGSSDSLDLETTAGSLTVTGALTTTGPVTLAAHTTLNAPALSTSKLVTLTANGGDVSEPNAISTSGGLAASATGGDLSLTSAANAVSGGISLTGNNITFSNNEATSIAAGNIAVNGTSGSLTLTTTTGDLTLTNAMSEPGAVNLSAAGILTTPSLTANGGITLSGASLSLANLSGAAVNLTANTGAIIGHSPITATGGLTANASHGDLVLDSLTNAVSSPINLTGANITFFNNQATSIPEGNFNVAADLTVKTTTGNLTVSGGGTFAPPGKVTFTAAGTLQTPNINATGDITLKGSTLNLGKVLSGGNVSLEQTAGDLSVDTSSGNFSAIGTVTLIADAGQLSITNSLVSSGDLTMTGDSISLGTKSVKSNTGNVSLDATGATGLSVDPANVTSSNNLTLTADTGALSIVNNNLTAPGSVSLTGKSISLNSNNLTSGNSSVTVHSTGAGSGLTVTGSTINAFTDVILQSSGALTADGSTLSPGANATLTATGALTVNNALTAPQAVSLTGSSISLGGTVSSTNAGVSLDATGGGLNIGQNLTASSGQLVSVTAAGDITQTTPISTAANFFADSTGGVVNLALTSNALTGTVTGLTGSSVTLADGSPMTVTGSGVHATGAANLTSLGLLTVSGALSAGSISLTGDGLSFGTLTSTSGGVSVDDTDAVTGLTIDPVASIASAKGVSLTSAAALTLTSNLTTPGDVALTGASITLNPGVTVTASSGGGITFEATGSALSVDPATITSSSFVNLKSDTGALTVSTNPLTAPGDITLTGTSVSWPGVLKSTGGGVSVEATGAALTVDPATISSADFVTLKSDGGALTVSGATSLTAPGVITLTGQSLSLGAAVTSTGSDVNINATAAGVALDQAVTASSGAVNLTASGDITQTAAISANGLSATSTGGSVNLSQAGNAISGVTTLAGVNATLHDADPLTVSGSGMNASSLLDLESSGALVVSGVLNNPGSIKLVGSGLVLGGPVLSTAGGISLEATGSGLLVNQSLQAPTGQLLSLKASGDITQTISISTAANFSAVSTGGVVNLYASSNAITGTVTALSGSSVALADGSPMTVTGSGVSATNALLLNSSGQLTVNGALNIGGSIDLIGSGLSLGGTVTSNNAGISLSATGGGLSIDEALQAPVGQLVSLSATGDITQTAPISTAANLTAVANGGVVNLPMTSNAITGTVTALGGSSVTLYDNAPLTVVGSGIAASTGLNLTSTGALTVSGSLDVDANVALTGASLGLGGLLKSNNGSVTLVATGGDLVLGQAVQANTTLNLQATSGGISQTAAFTTADLNVNPTSGVVNLGLNNTITGTVQSLHGSSITLTDGPAMTVNGPGVSTAGDLTLTSGNVLTISGGDLSAGGTISLTGSSIDTGHHHISAGSGLNLTTSGPQSVGDLTAAGNIGITGSSLTLTGPVQSTGGSVLLGASADALAVTQSVQAATTVTLHAQGDITQTAAITAGTGLLATSTGGDITLTSASNAITGPVTLTDTDATPGGGNVALTDGTTLTVASVSAPGTLNLGTVGPASALNVSGALTAGGDIALTGASLNLGGSVTSTGGGVSLDSTNSGLTLNESLTAGAGKTVSLVSSGAISQTAGAITAAALVGQSSGGTTLGLANDVGTLGPFTNTVSGALTVNSVSDLTLAGAIGNAPGAASITANSIAVNSPVTANSIALASTGGAIVGTGVLTAPAGLTAQANGGQLSLTGLNKVGGSIVLGGPAISFSNDQSTAFNAAGVTSTGSVSLATTTGDLSLSGTLNLPGDLTLTAAGALSAPAVTTTSGGVALTGASVVLGGDIQASAGAISVQSAAGLDLNHNLIAGGAVSLASGGQVVESASGGAVAAGKLDVTAAGGIAMNNANAVPLVDSLANTGGGGVSFHDTAANTTLGAVSTGAGDIQVSTTGALALNTGLTAPAGLTLTSGGDLTAGQLTLGGNLTLNAGGTATVSQIQGQAASQLAVSGTNVVLGAAAGQAPGAGQSVQGVLSITAQQSASVNLSGDVNVSQISAGNNASVSVQNGSAQVAAATLGAGGSLSIVTTGGDAVLGAAAGTTPAAGNIVTAPASAAIAVTGGRDAVVNLAGPVTLAALSAGRDAIAHTASGDLAVASAQAGRNLTVTSDSGNANLKTATITGLGTVTLTAAKTATLGRLPGEAAPTPAGTLTLDPDTVNISGASVLVDLTGDATLTSVKSLSGDSAISATGAVALGQASSSGKLSISAGGAATIGTAGAGGAESVISGGAIAISGGLTAPTLLLRGRQLTLGGTLQATQACGTSCAAPTLTIESAGGALGLGDGAGSAGLLISNAQFGRIQADAVTLYAGDTTNSAARGAVTIGDLTFDVAKVKTLTILAGPASTVSVTGAVLPAAGGSGALVIGAADSASGWTPKSIWVTGSRGSLGGGSPLSPLAAQKPLQSVTLNAVSDVLFGGDGFVTAINGAEAAGKANAINIDRNLPPGVAVVGADLNREFLTADTMTVRANGVIAQENTGATGQSNGIVLTNRAGAHTFATLGRTSIPTGGGLQPLVIDLSLGYFNAAGVLINQQIAAASSGVDLSGLPRADVYRINGCTIGAAGTCTPLPNTVVDISIGKLVQDIRLIAQAPPPAYDPTITGAGNEEIWRTTTCTPNGSGQCQ